MSEHRSSLGLSNNAAMGAISYLRTGNIVFDMILACLIPLAMRYFIDGAGRRTLENAWHRVQEMFRSSPTHECIRTISFHNSNRHGPSAFETRNEMLQKALVLYFTEEIGVNFTGKCQVALTSMNDSRWHMERPDKHNPLANYRLTWIAPESEWVMLCRDEQIEFRQFTVQNGVPGGDNNSGSNDKKETVVFELRCKASEGSARIDALIEKALDWYKTEIRRQRDDSRYLYVMSVVERFSISNTDKDDDGAKYKRYKLSDHKRFDSLFFPEKQGLLGILDDFQNKRGKFAINGYPHKLGLMLHGPPGTGKTSLIKALAHATGRSIISIPLSQIRTNAQLMDLMYDLKLSVEKGTEAPAYEFKDVIFVIEDVDAASKIVLRRDAKAAEPSQLPGPDDLKALAMAAARAGSPTDDEPGAGKAVGPKPPTMADVAELYRPTPDALNLAGLLNVLDGVVDTPGRLLVLTSNHPEKLDPALIRPGRVDRLIHLDYMKAPAACEMIAHYFEGTLDDKQRAKLGELFSAAETSVPLTPAVVEQLCASHETVDALLADLAEQAAERSAATSSPDKETGGTAGAGDGKVMKPAFVKRQTSGG